MAILGVKEIVLVYLCTVLSLSLSFLFGRLLPPRYVARALGWYHLFRARDLVTALEPLTSEEPANPIRASLPGWSDFFPRQEPVRFPAESYEKTPVRIRRIPRNLGGSQPHAFSSTGGNQL